MVDLEAARAAKLALTAMLDDDDRVSGIGIGGTDGHYVVKVNLVSGEDQPDLPEEIDGVPVKTAVVGRIFALG
jgi:hypothetical protein